MFPLHVAFKIGEWINGFFKLKEDYMPYTKEEILTDHPRHLLDADYFAEHRTVFNSCSEEEQKKLANEMITNCPPSELRNFNIIIQAAIAPEGTFYPIIATAHKVKSIILASLDERNRRPYDFLLAEFDLNAFKEFNSLALDTLSGNEKRIAERLVLCAPKNSHFKLIQNAHYAFPESTLTKEINKAFISQYEKETPEGQVSVAQSADTLFSTPPKQPPQSPEESAHQFNII